MRWNKTAASAASLKQETTSLSLTYMTRQPQQVSKFFNARGHMLIHIAFFSDLALSSSSALSASSSFPEAIFVDMRALAQSFKVDGIDGVDHGRERLQ